MLARFTLLTIMFSLLGCVSYTSATHTDTINHVSVEVTRVKADKPEDWHVYDLGDEKVVLPSQWRYADQNDYYFRAELNNDDPESYFVIVKQSVDVEPSYDYVKRMLDVLRHDKRQKLEGYSILKTRYADKIAYHCQYTVSIDQTKYILYSTVFEKDGYMFDIDLKDRESNRGLSQNNIDILYNLYYKNKLIFDEKKPIVSAEALQL